MLQLTVLGYILVPIFTSDRWCADALHAAICTSHPPCAWECKPAHACKACALNDALAAQRTLQQKMHVAVACRRYVTIGYAILMALVGAWEASSRPTWTFRVCMPCRAIGKLVVIGWLVTCSRHQHAIMGRQAFDRSANRLQGMFAEVVGCTMLASSIFLTYALIVVVRGVHISSLPAAQIPHAQPHAEHARGTALKPSPG